MSGTSSKVNMTEEFLHYLWKYKLFNKVLKNTDGETIIIKSSGEHNSDEGPDFLNARVVIGNTLWAGNVEIHINSSDWNNHNHSFHKLYNNIILHVVLNNDVQIFRSNNEKIPTVIIEDKYNKDLYLKYKSFQSSKLWIPCEKMFSNADPIIIQSWLNKIAIERFENKTAFLDIYLKKTKNDLRECFYILLARNFGFKINSDAFELLAANTPLNILCKHIDCRFQVESILFGQAGMLEKTFHDAYPNSLRKEYNYLKRKYNLEPIIFSNWKFLRTRPHNFPTIRISQIADLLCKTGNFLDSILEAKNVEKLMSLFNCEASEYFNSHFTFDKSSEKCKKVLGKRASISLIINTVIPFLFLYSRLHDNSKYSEYAINLLENMPPENNSIVSRWETICGKVNSALESQSLLELKTNYCNNKRCLNCRIGIFLLKNYQ